jgi:soluble lytic murein transglycosylase-like protein
MRRVALVVLLSACARTPAPTPAPAEPEPAPAPTTAEPEEPEPAAPEPTEPEPELPPLELTDAELARARSVQRIVAKAASEHGVDANLINGIIWVETKFNARARNPSGARGLMQLMPVTSKAMAKRLGRKHAPMDADFSIHAGTKLLAQLSEKYEGDEELALFGYARGIGSVANWRETPGQPMPEGVQSFIRKVRRAQAKFAELGFPDAARS